MRCIWLTKSPIKNTLTIKRLFFSTNCSRRGADPKKVWWRFRLRIRKLHKRRLAAVRCSFPWVIYKTSKMIRQHGHWLQLILLLSHASEEVLRYLCHLQGSLCIRLCNDDGRHRWEMTQLIPCRRNPHMEVPIAFRSFRCAVKALKIISQR